MNIVSRDIEFTFDDILILPNRSDFLIDEEISAISLKTKITNKISLDIPIVSSPMPGVTEKEMAIALGKVGGLGFIHPFQSYKDQLEQVFQVKKNKLKVAVAIKDFTPESIVHVGNLLQTRVDLFSIEYPHAQNQQIIEFIRKLKKKYRGIQITVSLIVTGSATEDLIKAGADSIRVGIGGGSHCTTRLVTGVGRPQISAIRECYSVARKYNIPVISDTGIKFPGDIAKALVFGADVVMIGGIFAGTKESPGKTIERNGKKYKYSWGMNTDMRFHRYRFSNRLFAQLIIPQLRNYLNKFFRKSKKIDQVTNLEEGIGRLVPYRGKVDKIINYLSSGLRRSMWYVGADSIRELREKARVVLVSQNTLIENIPRL